MAVKMEFYLNDSKFDQLMQVKEACGFADLTAAEFAKTLLDEAIRQYQQELADVAIIESVLDDAAADDGYDPEFDDELQAQLEEEEYL